MAKYTRLSPGIVDFFVMIAAVSLLAVQLASFADDPGVGWHLKTGEIILQNGWVPKADPFLAAAARRPWIADQWLSDALLAAGFRAGGWLLIYAAGFVLFMLIFFAVLLPEVSRQSGSLLCAIITALMAFKIAQIHFILRPVLLSFLFFAAVFVLLQRSRAERFWSLETAALILFFLLWCNLHPSFAIGLLLLALKVLSPLAEHLIWGARFDLRKFGLWSTRFLIAVLATLANPYGFLLHQSILWLADSDFFMGFHEEWRSPNFQAFEGQLLQVMLALLILPWLIARRLPEKISMFSMLSVICFTHLAFSSVRMLPYFGIVASVPIAQSIKLIGQAAVFHAPGTLRRFQQLLIQTENWEKRRARGFFGLSLSIGLAVVFALTNGRLPFHSGRLGPSPDKYPYRAMAELAEVKSGTILSVAEWGGFIVQQGYPRLKPVIDDRNTLVGEDFYREYLKRFSVRGDWAEYARKVQADYILLPADSNIAAVIKAQSWPIYYQDRLATLFVVPKQDNQ